MNIPQFIFIYSPIFRHLIISIFLVLQIKLQCMFTCKSIFRHTFSFLNRKYVGMELQKILKSSKAVVLAYTPT